MKNKSTFLKIDNKGTGYINDHIILHLQIMKPHMDHNNCYWFLILGRAQIQNVLEAQL